MDHQVPNPDREEEGAGHNQKESKSQGIEHAIDINTHCHSDGQHTPADLDDNNNIVSTVTI